MDQTESRKGLSDDSRLISSLISSPSEPHERHPEDLAPSDNAPISTGPVPSIISSLGRDDHHGGSHPSQHQDDHMEHEVSPRDSNNDTWMDEENPIVQHGSQGSERTPESQDREVKLERHTK